MYIIFITVKSLLCTKHVQEKLERIYACYITKITEEFEALKLLNTNV